MANDLFGGFSSLGDILGGIAKSVVPKDTPEGKLLAAQTDLTDLRKQESAIYLEIGKQAYAQDPSIWPQDAKLRLLQDNIAAAQAVLDDAEAEQKRADEAKRLEDEAREAEDAKGRCPECGTKNAEGVKFCRECGTPVAPAKAFCRECGAELAPNVRFCGECGARQDA